MNRRGAAQSSRNQKLTAESAETAEKENKNSLRSLRTPRSRSALLSGSRKYEEAEAVDGAIKQVATAAGAAHLLRQARNFRPLAGHSVQRCEAGHPRKSLSKAAAIRGSAPRRSLLEGPRIPFGWNSYDRLEHLLH